MSATIATQSGFTLFVVGLALAANIASVVGVWISGRQVRQALRVEKVKLFHSLRERVGSAEMIAAVDTLRSFRRQHGDKFVEIFVNQKQSIAQDKSVTELGISRRFFHRFIFDIASAYDIGALDRVLARRCLTAGIYYAYKEIDRPLSRGLYGRTRWRVEEIVDEIYSTADELLEFDDEDLRTWQRPMVTVPEP